MNIAEFTTKYATSDNQHEFGEDLIKLLTPVQYPNETQNVAIKVLTSFKNGELIISKGLLAFGKSGRALDSGILVSYSENRGLDERDWVYLLSALISNFLK